MWDHSIKLENPHFWAYFTEWCVVLMREKAGRVRGDNRLLSSHELIGVIPGLDVEIKRFRELRDKCFERYPFSSCRPWTYALDKCRDEGGQL